MGAFSCLDGRFYLRPAAAIRNLRAVRTRPPVLVTVGAALAAAALVVTTWPSRAGASPGDAQDDDDKIVDEVGSALVTRGAGKAVAFDAAWLEPFFKKGAAKAAVDKFREEDWAGAETGFSRAVRALPKK